MNSNIIKPEDINDWVEKITPAQLLQALELADTNDVSAFLDYFYTTLFIIDFDWPHWDEGKQFFNTPHPEFHKIDEVFGYKLLTVIIRSDRFIEGALEHNIENGTVSSILERLIEFKNES